MPTVDISLVWVAGQVGLAWGQIEAWSTQVPGHICICRHTYLHTYVCELLHRLFPLPDILSLLYPRSCLRWGLDLMSKKPLWLLVSIPLTCFSEPLRGRCLPCWSQSQGHL